MPSTHAMNGVSNSLLALIYCARALAPPAAAAAAMAAQGHGGAPHGPGGVTGQSQGLAARAPWVAGLLLCAVLTWVFVLCFGRLYLGEARIESAPRPRPFVA